MIRKDLNDNDQYFMLRVFVLKDEMTSFILSFNSFRNKFISSKFIKFKEKKIAKQS